jgi:putative phosphoribosyl transferase
MHADNASPLERELEIPAEGPVLPGNLVVPADAKGVVVFAHGSGSGRLSPRNLQVARSLEQARLGTLLFDLLTDQEANQREKVFDIVLLGRRLRAVTTWVVDEPELAGLSIGYFGASTGAAAALVAAAASGDRIRAVVSRGGRPDLAGPALPAVEAPTLLIVGSEDRLVLELNKQAQEQLRCPNDLIVVPGASHLFEEEGTLEVVAEHATRWFDRHFS